MNEPVAPPNFYKLYKDSTDSKQADSLLPPPPPPKAPEGFTVMEAMALGNNSMDDLPDPYGGEGGDMGLGGTLLEAYKPFDALYSTEEDPGETLRKLNRSLLFNYLQLLDVLASKASETKAQANKIEDIKTILYNINFLVDELKPFFVKEAILKKIEAQLSRKRKLIAELEESVRVNSEKMDAIYKGADTIFSGSEEVLAESEKLLNPEKKRLDASAGDVEMKVEGEGDGMDYDDDDDDDNNENDPETIQALLDTVAK